MYLYSRCSIPSYNVPTTFNGFIGVTGSDFGIYDDISTKSKPFSSANNGNLDFAKNGIVYKNEKDNCYSFGFTDSSNSLCSWREHRFALAYSQR